MSARGKRPDRLGRRAERKEDAARASAPKPGAKRGSTKTVLWCVLAVGLVVLLNVFVIRPYSIPSGSMQNTLGIGDRVLVNKITYLTRDVHDGDIVVFSSPSSWAQPGEPAGTTLIKRVIATGGQSVRCCDAQGRIQVKPAGSNTWLSLDEPYIFENFPLAQRTFPAVTVPQGKLWVMGDHRSNSADSLYHFRRNNRSAADSTVSTDAVVGQAVAVAWPIGHIGGLGIPDTFKDRGLADGYTFNPTLLHWFSTGLLILFVLIVLALLVNAVVNLVRRGHPQRPKPRRFGRKQVSEVPMETTGDKPWDESHQEHDRIRQ